MISNLSIPPSTPKKFYQQNFQSRKAVEEATRVSSMRHFSWFAHKSDVELGFQVASLEDDRNKSTDAALYVPFALRTYTAKNANWFNLGVTIRYCVSSGMLTEWDKLLSLDCPPYFLQCLQHPEQEGMIIRSRLIDWHGLSKALNEDEEFRVSVEATEKWNRDGFSSFVTVSIEELNKSELIVASRQDNTDGSFRAADYRAPKLNNLEQLSL